MDLTSRSNVDLSFEPSFRKKGRFLVLDTETTGLITKSLSEANYPEGLPRIIQAAWLLFDEEGKLITAHNRFIFQEKPIPPHSTRIHGIDDAHVQEKGEAPVVVWNDFIKDIENCDYLIAHNIDFDLPVIEGELKRLQISNIFAGKRMICTMKQGKSFCRIPSEDGNSFRHPDLEELYKMAYFGRLTDQPITGLHDAYVDAAITAKAFFKLLTTKQILLADAPEKPFMLPETSRKEEVVKSKFFINIILPTFLTIILFLLTIFLIIIPRFRENIMLGKRQMIKELTNSATSILEKYEQDERNGLMTRAEAQQTAISRIAYLRYGDEHKDYFWITDMKPDMIMHPYRKDLDGKSLKNFTDPLGKKLFVEMVQVAGNKGEGYSDYMWQWKDDPAHIVPKLSFVKLFKPWGWIIGTGIYIEDVQKEIRSLTQRLLFATLGISLVIALLLSYTTLQSMKIEKKRRETESLLHVSKEKYKTLVEATTEGLIMIIDRKIIFSNNKIHELTGYPENELVNQSFHFLVSEKNHPEMAEIFEKRDVPDGQYEVLLNSKNGDSIEVIATISSITFYEQQGKIVIIKDATIQKHPEGSVEDIIRLMEFAGIGFIRVLLDGKGKFLYAGPEIVKLLGFQSFQDLSQFSILDFFSDPAEKKKYRTQLFASGYIKSPAIHIKRNGGGILTVSVSMVLVKNDAQQLLGDGIITDITQMKREKIENEKLISRLDAHAHLLQSPVAPLIVPVGEVSIETTVARIIEWMNRNHADTVMVSKGDGVKIGIITARDIIDRVLFTDGNLQKPAWEIMSAPLTCLDPGATILKAVSMMKNAGISRIAVKNTAGDILGLVRKKEICGSLLSSFAMIEGQIDHAQTIGELSNLYRAFRKYICLMIRQKIQPVTIGESMASVADRITQRLINLAIEEIGNPPVAFAFIALGSEGRMEQTLATDQDNAIIYSDLTDEEPQKVQAFFDKLGEIVCNNLNTIGFTYCKGGIMAKNPRWCKPMQTWKGYFSQWMSNTEPKNLLEVSIFFDLRTVYGSAALTEELRQHINRVSDGNGAFFYNLAENIKSFKSALGITGNIHAEKKDDKDYLNLKNAVTPYIMFARAYTLHQKISLTNTQRRISALSDAQVITAESGKEVLFGYDFLMQLRYRNQVDQIENEEEVNNLLVLQELSETEEIILKKVLGQSSELQNQLNIDFKGTVL